MQEGDETPKTMLLPLALWLALAGLIGMLAVAILSQVYTSFMDCSIVETYESANTTLGWVVAIGATLAPIALILWARPSRLALGLILIGAALEMWLWTSFFAPCDWQQALGSVTSLV